MPGSPAATSPLAQAPRSPRVQLKPGVPTTAFVDGGWWPESRNLTGELPALLSMLTPIIGQVAMVGYHRTGWDAAPDHLGTGDQVVLLQGWSADVPCSVVVIAHSGQRVTLLVIAPESTAPAAEQALSDACEPPAATKDTAESAQSINRSMAETIERISSLERVTAPADRDRIVRWVDEAARQFVGAPIQSFVPILVEHIVRSRLAGAAAAEEAGA